MTPYEENAKVDLDRDGQSFMGTKAYSWRSEAWESMSLGGSL